MAEPTIDPPTTAVDDFISKVRSRSNPSEYSQGRQAQGNPSGGSTRVQAIPTTDRPATTGGESGEVSATATPEGDTWEAIKDLGYRAKNAVDSAMSGLYNLPATLIDTVDGAVQDLVFMTAGGNLDRKTFNQVWKDARDVRRASGASPDQALRDASANLAQWAMNSRHATPDLDAAMNSGGARGEAFKFGSAVADFIPQVAEIMATRGIGGTNTMAAALSTAQGSLPVLTGIYDEAKKNGIDARDVAPYALSVTAANAIIEGTLGIEANFFGNGSVGRVSRTLGKMLGYEGSALARPAIKELSEEAAKGAFKQIAGRAKNGVSQELLEDFTTEYVKGLSGRLKAFGKGFVEEGLLEEVPQTLIEEGGKRLFNASASAGVPGNGAFEEKGGLELAKDALVSGFYGGLIGGGASASFFYNPSTEQKQTLFSYIDEANQRGTKDVRVQKLQTLGQELLSEGTINQDQYDQTMANLSKMSQVSDFFKGKTFAGRPASGEARLQAFNLIDAYNETSNVIRNWDEQVTQQGIQSQVPQDDPGMQNLYKVDTQNKLLQGELDYNKAKELSTLISSAQSQLAQEGMMDNRDFALKVAEINGKSYADYGLAEPEMGYYAPTEFVPGKSISYGGQTFVKANARRPAYAMFDGNGYKRMDSETASKAQALFSYDNLTDALIESEYGGEKLGKYDQQEIEAVQELPEFKDILEAKQTQIEPQIIATAQAVASNQMLTDEQSNINKRFKKEVNKRVREFKKQAAAEEKETQRLETEARKGLQEQAQQVLSGTLAVAEASPEVVATLTPQFTKRFSAITNGLAALNKRMGGARTLDFDEFSALPIEDQVNLFRIATQKGAGVEVRGNAYQQILSNNNIDLTNALDPATQIAGEVRQADRATANLAQTERSLVSVEASLRAVEEAGQEPVDGGSAEVPDLGEQLDQAIRDSGSALESLQQLAGSVGLEVALDTQAGDVAESSETRGQRDTGTDERAAEPVADEVAPVDSTVVYNPSTEPDFYLATPNANGSFADNRQTVFDPSQALFEARLVSPTRAELKISENRAVQGDAMRFPETFLGPITRDVPATSTGYRTVSPAIIELVDGTWVLRTPMELISMESLQRTAPSAVQSSPNAAVNEQVANTQTRTTPRQAQLLGRVLQMSLPGQVIIPESVDAYTEAYRAAGGQRIEVPIGFERSGKVYVDPSRINLETPIHEFGHLWTKFIKTNNPTVYNRGLELARQATFLSRDVKATYPNLSGNALHEEVLATIIGRKGVDYINSRGGVDNLSEVLEPSLFRRIQNWLKDLWDSIKQSFGASADPWNQVQDMTLSEYAQRAAADLLEGRQLTDVAADTEDQISEQVPFITASASRVDNPLPTLAQFRDRLSDGSYFEDMTGAPMIDIVNQIQDDFEGIVNTLADEKVLTDEEAALLSDREALDEVAYQIRQGRGASLTDPSETSTRGLISARIKGEKGKALWKMLFGSPRGSESLGQTYANWFRDNYVPVAGTDGNQWRRIVADDEIQSVKNMEGKLSRAVKTLGFVNLTDLFGLRNESGGFGRRRANAQTFGMLMGEEGAIIRDLMGPVRMENNRKGAWLSAFDTKNEADIFRAMARYTTYAGISTPDTVETVTIRAKNFGVDQEVEVPVAVAMDLYGQYKSQLDSYERAEGPRSSVIYDSERNLTEKTPEGKERGAHVKAWRSNTNDMMLLLDADQASALESLFEEGGQYAREFRLLADHFNNTQRFNLLNDTVQRLMGKSLARTGFYWPTRAYQERTSLSNLTGVDPLLFEMGFLQDRTAMPSAINVGDAVSMLASHNRRARRLVENGDLLRGLAAWNDKVGLHNGYSTRVNNLRDTFLEEYMKDLNGTSKAAQERDNEDEKWPKVIAKNATISIFASNLGTPAKNFTGFSVAYGQGLLDNGSLSRALPRVIGRTLGSYGGFFNWLTVKDGDVQATNPSEDYWADREAIERIENNPYAASVYWRVAGGQHDSVFVTLADTDWKNADLNEIKRMVSADDFRDLQRALRATGNTALRARQYANQRFLSALARADRAVIIGFYEAAEDQVMQERGEITSDEAQKRIAELAEATMYATNNTSFENDKTGLQRSANFFTRTLGLFSAQQQKVTNLVVQDVVRYAEDPSPENRKRLDTAVFVGVLLNAVLAGLIGEGIREVKNFLSGTERSPQDDSTLAGNIAWATVYALFGYAPGFPSAVAASVLSTVDNRPFVTDIGVGINVAALNESIEAVDQMVSNYRKDRDIFTRATVVPFSRGLAKATATPGTAVDVAVSRLFPKQQERKRSARRNSYRQTN